VLTAVIIYQKPTQISDDMVKVFSYKEHVECFFLLLFILIAYTSSLFKV
jgi:hypothetical protein